MNRERRKALNALAEQVRELSSQFDHLREQAEELRDQEQEARDNLPESLQDGERGQLMQETIDAIEDAVSELDSIEQQLAIVCDVALSQGKRVALSGGVIEHRKSRDTLSTSLSVSYDYKLLDAGEEPPPGWVLIAPPTGRRGRQRTPYQNALRARVQTGRD